MTPPSSSARQIQAVEADEASAADVMWAKLATLPPAMLKDRASRTDDPEIKRQLIALAQRRPAPDRSVEVGHQAAAIRAGMNAEDGNDFPS